MRDRLWTELTQAKFNIEFAALYAFRQRLVLRYFNICVLIFSTGGIMGWSVWDKIPLIACIIIAMVSLLRLIQPHIIMSEKQIINLDAINEFYFDYFNKLEKLWFDFENNSIDEEATKIEFYEIKNSESEINLIVNDNIKTKPKSLVNKAKLYSDQYFKQSFNT
jgi:hypothetical protein